MMIPVFLLLMAVLFSHARGQSSMDGSGMSPSPSTGTELLRIPGVIILIIVGTCLVTLLLLILALYIFILCFGSHKRRKKQKKRREYQRKQQVTEPVTMHEIAYENFQEDIQDEEFQLPDDTEALTRTFSSDEPAVSTFQKQTATAPLLEMIDNDEEDSEEDRKIDEEEVEDEEKEEEEDEEEDDDEEEEEEEEGEEGEGEEGKKEEDAAFDELRQSMEDLSRSLDLEQTSDDD